MFQRKLQFLLLICICTSIKAEEIPNCDYFDTVDLTYSEELANGSYLFEKVEIPPEQTGTYNYKILFEGTKITVEEHRRGCVCKFKPCIRYCCHRHRLDPADERKCTSELNDYQVNITLDNGTQIETSIRNQFVVQPGIRIECKNDNHIGPFTHNDDYKLFENGTLYRSNNIGYLSKREYCIQPEELADKGFNYMLLPLNCLFIFEFLYVSLTASFVVFLTACIYIFKLELKRIPDKCYACYLISVLVTLLSDIIINSETYMFGTNCYFLAYLNYFSSISINIWMTLMAFALWRDLALNIFVSSQDTKRLGFWKYHLFGWGTASVLLLITILADLMENLDIDVNWKMGYVYYECYFKTFDWSGVLYFFGPLTLMTFINIMFIIATVWHNHFVNRKNRKELREFGAHNIRKNFISGIFLRILLIFIMDLLVEICEFVYLASIRPTKLNYYFLIYLNMVYCILILGLTVTRRDFRKLVTWWRATCFLKNN